MEEVSETLTSKWRGSRRTRSGRWTAWRQTRTPSRASGTRSTTSRGEIQDVRSESRRVDDKLTHAIHDGILTITNELHRGFLSITDKIHVGNLAIRKEEIDPLKKSVAGLESTRTYQSWAVGIVAIGILAVLATLIALVAKGFTG